MKGGKRKEGLLRENEFFNETGLDEKTRELYEKGGYLTPTKIVRGVKYYSEEAVEIVKTMKLCLGRCADLREAHQITIQGLELKKRRSSEAGSVELVMVDPRTIKTHPKFEGILTINENLEESLTVDMAVGIYYESQPVVLGTWPGQEEPVLIDGHTRRKAAIAAGIKEIPAFLEKFDSENGALTYVAKVQTQRRSNDDWVRYQLIVELDSLMERGGDRRSAQAKSKGSQDPIETKYSNSAERTGALVGCSATTVKRARRIHRAGWPSLLEDLKKGEKIITQAEQAIAKKANGEAEQRNGEQASDAESENSLVHIEGEYREILSQVEGTLHEHVNKACKMYIWWLRQKKRLPKEEQPDE